MSELGMAELAKRELIDVCDLSKFEFCEHCIFGKHKRVKFNAFVHTTKGILDHVHADVWGLSRRTSNGGANYMLTIIDDYSRKVWQYFLKHKSHYGCVASHSTLRISMSSVTKILMLPALSRGLIPRQHRNIPPRKFFF
jgi:hypothetical protein